MTIRAPTRPVETARSTTESDSSPGRPLESNLEASKDHEDPQGRQRDPRRDGGDPTTEPVVGTATSKPTVSTIPSPVTSEAPASPALVEPDLDDRSPPSAAAAAIAAPIPDLLAGKRNLADSRGDEDDSSVESVEDEVQAPSTSPVPRSRRPPKKLAKSLRVRFADPIVTCIHTRPKTLPEDKRILHYSFEEMDRFRADYYRTMEEEPIDSSMGDVSDVEDIWQEDEWQAAASSLSTVLGDVNPDDCPTFDDLHVVLDDRSCNFGFPEEEAPTAPASLEEVKQPVQTSTTTNNTTATLTYPFNKPTKTPISKVTVIHHDVQQEYYSGEDCDAASDSSSGSNESRGNATINDDSFFDNPAFWNGTLTYY